MQVPTRQKFGLKVASFGLRGPSELTFGRSGRSGHRSQRTQRGPDPPPPHLESIVSYRIGAFAAATRIVSGLLIRIEYSPDPIRPRTESLHNGYIIGNVETSTPSHIIGNGETIQLGDRDGGTA